MATRKTKKRAAPRRKASWKQHLTPENIIGFLGQVVVPLVVVAVEVHALKNRPPPYYDDGLRRALKLFKRH